MPCKKQITGCCLIVCGGSPSLAMGSNCASAGNRTRDTSMATMYSTTRPLMRMSHDLPQAHNLVVCNNNGSHLQRVPGHPRRASLARDAPRSSSHPQGHAGNFYGGARHNSATIVRLSGAGPAHTFTMRGARPYLTRNGAAACAPRGGHDARVARQRPGRHTCRNIRGQSAARFACPEAHETCKLRAVARRRVPAGRPRRADGRRHGKQGNVYTS